MKRQNLANALHKASGKAIDPAPEAETAATKPPSRTGKRIIAGHFDPAVVRQLKQMALDSDTTIQAFLSEALNDLFIKHGQKPIA